MNRCLKNGSFAEYGLCHANITGKLHWLGGKCKFAYKTAAKLLNSIQRTVSLRRTTLPSLVCGKRQRTEPTSQRGQSTGRLTTQTCSWLQLRYLYSVPYLLCNFFKSGSFLSPTMDHVGWALLYPKYQDRKYQTWPQRTLSRTNQSIINLILKDKPCFVHVPHSFFRLFLFTAMRKDSLGELT